MTKLPEGKSRLDLVREGGLAAASIAKRGRLIVSLDKLREDPRNERKTFRNLDGLVASIKAVGLIEPITVTPEEGSPDAFRIITGHRRYRAAKIAGLTQVEVLIRDPEDERTRRQKSIISNVQRDDVGPLEMAEALQSMMVEDERIKSQDDLARVIGKNKYWVSGMLRLLTLPPELQKKVAPAQQAISYDSMIAIARLDDPVRQSNLIDMLLDGATRGEIRKQVDAFKGKPPASNAATATPAKPKRVYSTKYQATVIVQATGKRLTQDQILGALQEALGRATGLHGDASDAEC